MAQVDHCLTKVNVFDQIIRVNESHMKTLGFTINKLELDHAPSRLTLFAASS
jgi:hypothetical protein